jgi:hypothetical protein
MPLKLSAPKVITFIISVIVAIIAVVIHYTQIAIPHAHSGFVVLLAGYLILVAAKRPWRHLSRSMPGTPDPIAATL